MKQVSGSKHSRQRYSFFPQLNYAKPPCPTLDARRCELCAAATSNFDVRGTARDWRSRTHNDVARATKYLEASCASGASLQGPYRAGRAWIYSFDSGAPNQRCTTLFDAYKSNFEVRATAKHWDDKPVFCANVASNCTCKSPLVI